MGGAFQNGKHPTKPSHPGLTVDPLHTCQVPGSAMCSMCALTRSRTPQNGLVANGSPLDCAARTSKACASTKRWRMKMSWSQWVSQNMGR